MVTTKGANKRNITMTRIVYLSIVVCNASLNVTKKVVSVATLGIFHW